LGASPCESRTLPSKKKTADKGCFFVHGHHISAQNLFTTLSVYLDNLFVKTFNKNIVLYKMQIKLKQDI